MTISMINSEWEKISITTIKEGKFKGQKILVIHDDSAVSNTQAAMLLDKGTVKWLLLALKDIESKEVSSDDST